MENNEVTIKQILDNEDDAINWLNSIKDTNFNNSLEILYKYAQKCLEDLDQKSLEEEISVEKKGKIITAVKGHFNKQRDFKKKCIIRTSDNKGLSNVEKFRLNLFTEEEIKWIQELNDEEIEKLSSEEPNESSKEMLYKIRKANRFYNMQLKLAHTARIVKVADEVLKQFEGKINPDLKEIILTSAMLHDIGRFYQAKEFDDFNDRNLVVDEEKKLNGHAKAGYYYSIMDSFRLNYLDDPLDNELLTKTAAAFVVSYHGDANIKLEEANIGITEENLIEDFDEEDLKKLFTKIYENAEEIDPSYSNITQQEFIKKFIDEMILEKGIDTFASLDIEESGREEIARKIAVELEKNNQKSNTTENTEVSDEAIEKLHNALKIGTDIDFDLEDIRKVLTSIKNYDVAESIYEMFKEEKVSDGENKIMQTLFAFPIDIVTDADKIDILNQLATGVYPLNGTYNPNEYTLYNFVKDGKKEECGKFGKDKAFDKYFSNTEKNEIITLKSDKENFYKYNGLDIKHNISPVRTTLWLMNQFIFTNMRNKTSIDIIRDNRFIERTYEQFSEEPNMQKILKPYMAYTLFFLDNVSEKGNNILSGKVMQGFCEELYSEYQENEQLRTQYEALFDGNLLENREQFFEEKTKKTMSLGNTPTSKDIAKVSIENGITSNQIGVAGLLVEEPVKENGNNPRGDA